MKKIWLDDLNKQIKEGLGVVKTALTPQEAAEALFDYNIKKSKANLEVKLEKQRAELKKLEKENTVKKRFNKLPKLLTNPIKKLNNIIRLNLDSVSYNKKPSGKEIGAIQNRLNNNIVKIHIKDFAEAVALNGRTFKAAALEGKTNNAWIGQDVFCLDVDNKYGKKEKVYPYLSMEEAYKRCVRYNIEPLFIYPSFTSTPELNKYRLVFKVPTTVKDLRVRRLVIMALMEIFPERDKSCIDAARTFFGGCQKLYKFNAKATINPMDLILSVQQYLKDTKGSNYSGAIKNFAAKTGVNLINGLLDVRLLQKGETANVIYNKNIGINFSMSEDKVNTLINSTNSKNIKAKFNINVVKTKTETSIKNFNFKELENNCRLWADLVNGFKLSHQEIFSIACTMWNVEGAEKRIVEAIQANNAYGSKAANKINTVSSCRRYKYSPRKCIDFCPYYNSCAKRGLMLNVVDNKRGNIRKLNMEEKRITLEEAEIKLKEFMEDALKKDNNNDIVIIKAPTGIGKTTALGELKDLLENTCIAYPSHKLGEDIQERLNLDALYCKGLSLNDKEVLEVFKTLQTIGDYRGANAYLDTYLKVCAANLANDKYLKDLEAINIYKALNAEVQKTDKAILCTHHKALLLNNKNLKKYIFDEDVFYNTCFKTMDVDFKELNNAIVEAKKLGLNNLAATLKHVSTLATNAKITPDAIIENNITCVNLKEIKQLYLINNHNNLLNPNIKIDIQQLLKCRYFKANNNGEVLGAYIKDLPNKRCIILSATANVEVYKEAFKNRNVIVKDLGLVEEKGQTILHYKSFSRTGLNNNMEKHIEIIRKEAPEVDNIITFATKEHNFKKEGFNTIAHFGNCAGIDKYKGEDLIVAGTPHVDARSYILMAKLLKKDILIEDNQFDFINIKKNGFEFSLNTFWDGCGQNVELLREIQAYFIESELVQAVGRARTLRTNATVHLFSNYPLKGCQLYNKNAA